jgi:diguanylate cyclase (GGDEF)-like protein
MQISTKIALSISGLALLASVVASSIAFSEQEAERRQSFAEDSQRSVQLVAASIAPVVAEGRHHRAQEVLDMVANFSEEFGSAKLEVIDRQNRIIAHYDPRKFNTPADPLLTPVQLADAQPSHHWNSQDDTLVVIVPLKSAHMLGFTRAKFQAHDIHDSIERQQTKSTIFVLATMMLIGLGLYVMHRRLVSDRLGVLDRAARKLGEGDRDVRANADGEDEIAHLGQSFNSMADAIKVYTEDLEELVAERTSELHTAMRQLEQLAITDQLTELFNRRHFDQTARRALEVARRNERPLSLVLIDTDHFKSVNDNFGHPVGDVVLKAVARVLEDNARKADLVARIGGEEFAILMPEAGLGLAAQAAERMREALEREVEPQVKQLEGRLITASFGVAAFEKADDTLDDLLLAADEAMYRSKEEGRNRVTLAERDETANPPPVDTRET